MYVGTHQVIRKHMYAQGNTMSKDGFGQGMHGTVPCQSVMKSH